MKVIVTDGAGFIGQYVVRRLRSEEVYVIPADINAKASEIKYLDVAELVRE
jgi:nucleoside-diphosphate-sugar epimerase